MGNGEVRAYIPHAPGESFHSVVEFSAIMKEAGFTPIPHLCARRLDYQELKGGLHALNDLGINTVLLLGGDVTEEDRRAKNAFKSSSDVLETGLLEESGISTVLFGGHPEGNALNDSAQGSDWDVLTYKMEAAVNRGLQTGVVTQASYNAKAVGEWAKNLCDDCNNDTTWVRVLGTMIIDGRDTTIARRA